MPTRTESSQELAESLRVAHGIAVWTLGGSASVRHPDTDSGTYMGQVIGETKYHMIQRVSAQSAIAHPKELLNNVPLVGQAVRIHYSNEQGSVRDWQVRHRNRGLER